MIIIKLSGKALDDKASLQVLFSKLHNQDALIVHGGGVEVDKLLQALDFTSEKLNGIRVSPKEHMPYITASLAGQCNKLLQATAIQSQVKAVGLLCTDFDLCSLQPYAQEFGNVASCKVKDTSFIQFLIQNKQVLPIICSIGINEQGDLFNINADEVAAALAVSLHAPLVFFSDVNGVLDDTGKVIDEIDSQSFNQLLTKGVIKDGMAVKVENALKVAKQSGAPIFISSMQDKNALDNLFTLQGFGTTIRA